MAAHDLAAPLAAIRMHVRAKERQQSAPAAAIAEDWLASLAWIDKLAASAQRMIDDVLAVERLEEHSACDAPVSIVDAEKILGDVVVMHGPALERAGCSIFVTRRDDLERVLGNWNPISLHRLFGNLVQNVVRHAPGAPIEVSFARQGEHLGIHFADGGPGLSRDEGVESAFVESAWAASAQAEPANGESGHGLGLWIVYRTVAEMGGEICMKSIAGRGLAFDIRLPFGV